MKTLALTIGAIAALGIISAMGLIADAIRPVPSPPTLEFSGNPVATDIDGGKVTFVYQMRRNESCQTKIHIRWYNLDRKAYDVDYALTVEATRAPITDQFEPFPIRLSHPVEPGNWAYAPLIDPGPDCKFKGQMQPPLAVVKVERP